MNRRPALRKMGSGEIARRRLKFLLTADKTGLPPETLEMIREDIGRAVSRYMGTDAGQIEVRLSCVTPAGESTGAVPALYAVIPMKSLKYKGML